MLACGSATDGGRPEPCPARSEAPISGARPGRNVGFAGRHAARGPGRNYVTSVAVAGSDEFGTETGRDHRSTSQRTTRTAT